MIIKEKCRDCPGCPVVKTLSFHCRRQGFNPCLGQLRSNLAGAVKKKKRCWVCEFSHWTGSGLKYGGGVSWKVFPKKELLKKGQN